MKRSSNYFTLRHFVECRELPDGFWQVIAAFNIKIAANTYARECAIGKSGLLEYRVTERSKRHG